MRVLLILFFILNLPNISFGEEVKWKFKSQIDHENYHETIAEGEKTVEINGVSKRIKLINKHYFPLKKKNTTEKKWYCKPWQIEEISYEGRYVKRSYTLNDCLPCIDKGEGHLCSYPYFSVFFITGLYDLYYKNRDSSLKIDLMSDGTKDISISANMGSREKFQILKRRIKLPESLGLGDGEMLHILSRFLKYNTRLRKIESESTEYKKTTKVIHQMIFDRIANRAHALINSPGELKIREKDLKILFSTEKSASIIKFQTRD